MLKNSYLSQRVPVGIENFAELVDFTHQGLFVDRTPWLVNLLREQAKVIAFHTFRRSGKSLTASMIEHFFGSHVVNQPTQGLFDRLEIGQTDPKFVAEHQGKYPVIALTLKDVQSNTYEKALETLTYIVVRAFERYSELGSSLELSHAQRQTYLRYSSLHESKNWSEVELAQSLRVLNDLLFVHHGRQRKVFIVVDEYDAPMATAARHGYLEPMTIFMREFLGSALKTNDSLQKGFLFGILRISKESLLSGLNNPQIYTLFQQGPYEPYFGFTEAEVENLIKMAGLREDTLQNMKVWYDGYKVGRYSLYNPYSVMSYLKSEKNEPRSFWANTSNDDLIKKCFLNAPKETKDHIRAMIADHNAHVEVTLNETVRFDEVETDTDALWALMYATGYLTAAGPLTAINANYRGLVRIPNHEVHGVYLTSFAQWLAEVVVKRRGASLEPLYNAIDHGEVDTFGKYLGDFLMTHTSYYNLKKEESYHSLLLGLTAGLYETHKIFSETEAGHGRADLVIIPRETYKRSQAAWIFEFKRPQKMPKNIEEEEEESLAESLAKEALGQIETQAYQDFLKKFPYVTKIFSVGIGFVKKEVRWESAETNL